MRRLTIATVFACMFVPGFTQAQDAQTLADIRQELTVLNVEIQQLRRELSTTGAPSTNLSGGSVLDRIAAIEAELTRLTSQTERLTFRIDRIVTDGTNRIGDLEFRLVELEGGDLSTLAETTTLGGDVGTPVPTVPDVDQDLESTELAIGEQADFDAAVAVLEAGDFQRAADLLTQFESNYPGSPLSQKAFFARGRALEGLGDTRAAARAYLASFSSDSTGPDAPEALYELGASLGELGQVSQACITLGEVSARFPAASAVELARSEMVKLGCT